jgi:hypothetical protein
MKPSRFACLQRALDSSEAMLDAARDERWDDVVALERQRAAWLRDYDAAAGGGEASDDPGAVRDLMKRLVETNRRILEHSESRRARLLGNSIDHRRQRRAAGAYAASSRQDR